MFVRSVAVCGVVLVVAAGAIAQTNAVGPLAPPNDRPAELPPLLAPPTGGQPQTSPPMAVVPRGPTGEYDHGYQYLPEAAPVAPAPPEQCRPLGRWWVDPSLELAWTPTRPAPGTVRLRVPNGTGGSVPGPLLPVAGVAPDQFQGGFGLSLGRWFGESNRNGIDASMFTLANTTRGVTGTAPGMLVLFPDGTAQGNPQVAVLPPGTPVTGLFPATLSTWFIGADVNFRHNLYCSPNARLDFVGGYRFAYLRDELYLGDEPDPDHDNHRANRAAVANQFHAKQFGLAGEYRAGNWFVAGTAKAAFGVVISQITATGLFTGAEGATPAGAFDRLAALTSATHTRFGVLPTANVAVGRQLGKHSRAFVGYSFQYLSGVTRLGDVLNPTSGPTANHTDFWVQAVNFGLDFRY